MSLRIATFNLENLDDDPEVKPILADRIRIMRPQLRRLRADVLCLQEVHSQGASGARTLSALDELLTDTDYAGFHRQSTLTTDQQFYDVRNVVTLSRHPITATEIIRDSSGPRPSYKMATADPEQTEAEPLAWERPLLYTQLALPSGSILHLVNCHLKSKLASSVPGQKLDRFTWKSVSAWAEGSFISAMKRVGQALQIRLLIDEIFDRQGDDALIAVCGDLNSESDDVPVRTICGHIEETGNPLHTPRLMIPCQNSIPDSVRYSLLHLGQGQMLDHIIASRPLIGYLSDAKIHNEALPDESGAFRQDTKFPESDHAPVVAEFELG